MLSKGLFFTQERVLPVDFVAEVDSDLAVLDKDVEIDDLAEFEETYYLELDEAQVRSDYPAANSGVLVWGYPAFGAMAPGPTFSRYMAAPMAVAKTELNIPGDSVAIETGADVVTTDGEKIGKVAGVSTTESGDIVSFDIDPGWFQSRQTIPAHFIDTIGAEEVKLGMPAVSLAAWRDRHQN